MAALRTPLIAAPGSAVGKTPPDTGLAGPHDPVVARAAVLMTPVSARQATIALPIASAATCGPYAKFALYAGLSACGLLASAGVQVPFAERARAWTNPEAE